MPDIAMTGLPQRTFDVLWHVGSMNPADKRARSWEGQGLSVSEHPEEWTAIARLGGLPVWRLTRPDNRFLDYHTLTDEQWTEIAAWGIERGYVERLTVYRVPVDGEDGEGFFAFLSRDEADAEADGWDDRPVTEAGALVATATFPDPTVAAGTIDPDQILTIAWLAETQPGFDGVWFDDLYAPDMLSCPRGVIHPHRLTAWTITREVAE